MVKPIYYIHQNVDWNALSRNPNAIPLLEQNLDKVNWHNLSKNPNAIHLLEQNINKVDWDYLSLNPSAIHLLAPLDHQKMKENISLFKEELIEYVFNPQRLVRLAIYLGITFDELNEFY